MRNSNMGFSLNNNQSITSFSTSGNCDQSIEEEEEESGWTSYFDDFFSNKNFHLSASKHKDEMAYGDEDGYHNGSGSAVSDAASCAAWKSECKNCDARSTNRAEAKEACTSHDVSHSKLRFKKTSRHKRRPDYFDDSLEDTASSLVNSFKARGDQYGYDHQQGQEKGFREQMVEVSKSLKEKGLCMVPYSMLTNYTGN